jgi:hypothetical protein
LVCDARTQPRASRCRLADGRILTAPRVLRPVNLM